MRYGRSSSWQRPDDAASSSRAPSVEREDQRPCGAIRPEQDDGFKVAVTDPTADASMGSRSRSTALTSVEEAMVVEFRRRTLLPLDDVLGTA